MAKEMIPVSEGEIVLYQPDDSIRIEVKLDASHDTVWLTKRQMAELFGRNRTTISRHISNTFEQGEVDPKVGCAFFAQTTRHGAIEGKTQTDDIEFYNLDVIISVGYRVKSQQGVLFRRWATSVLREHLLRGYSVNQQLVALQQHVDDRLLRIEERLQQNEEQVEFLVRTHQEPTYQVYNNGCVFDAWAYVSDLVRKATQRIILIDNYVDDRVLSIMHKRADGVICTIHTRYTEQFQTDLKKHNEQYPEIRYVQLPHRKHDRYLILDDVVYMLGDSLKNMGGSLTAIIRTEMSPDEVLGKLD